MTPAGWMESEIGLLGVAWLFGGLLVVALPAGVLVGRLSGKSELGLATGLLVWGAGNLLVSGVGVVWMQFDSVVVSLQASGCAEQTDRKGQPVFQLSYAVPASVPSAAPRLAEGAVLHRGRCPAAAEVARERANWRVRRDALADPAAVVRLDDAEDGLLPLIVIWAVFGGAGLLMGTLLLAHVRGGGKPVASAPEPVARWRLSAGARMGQLGGLVLLSAFIVPFLLPGPLELAVGFGLRALASGFALLIAGGLLARTLHWGAALFLAFFASVALGLAELVRHTGLT